jgi:hypothetical protein
MKQKLFTRPISVVISVEMFDQIKAITDQRNIALSDYIREALQAKLEACDKNKNNKKGEFYGR